MNNTEPPQTRWPKVASGVCIICGSALVCFFAVTCEPWTFWTLQLNERRTRKVSEERGMNIRRVCKICGVSEDEHHTRPANRYLTVTLPSGVTVTVWLVIGLVRTNRTLP